MKIAFQCTACEQDVRIPHPPPGKLPICPECGTENPLPETDPEATTCPGCGGEMHPTAVLCVTCGFDRRTGQQRTTRVKRLDLDFDVGLPPTARLVLFLLILLLLVGGTVSLLLLSRLEALPVLGAAGGVAFLALLGLGTYSRLNLKRQKQGNLVLKRHRWIAFVFTGSQTLDLRRYDGVIAEAQVGTSSLYLLLTLVNSLLGIVTGFRVPLTQEARDGLSQGFTYCVFLRTSYGHERECIYRGLSESTMHEISDALIRIAGLERL